MLEPGTVITLELGHYRLREQIAGSSYGLVWRADGPRAGQQVALKLINHEQMACADAHQRARWVESAQKEIAFLQSLAPWDERHIVRLLDQGEHAGLPVMALELLSGDLARHVNSARVAGRLIALPQILDWLGQINQALAKVHQYGWRYLDLKPANVLLDAHTGTLKLADFGTNRLLAEHLHSYAGTANWQAPEQFFPAHQHSYDTDARTDYFALGAMFYYLVTGGLALRFCGDCGQAYRAHQGAGAQVLQRQYRDCMPPTLRPDEAALFTHRIDQQLRDAELPHRPRQGKNSIGADALSMLRQLLSAEREGRPQHAIDISRMIAAIRADIDQPSPGLARRAPAPSQACAPLRHLR